VTGPGHRYRASCAWRGTTADGYDAYDRAHELRCPPASAALNLSSDPAFRGDGARLNPEQLLLAAAVSCQLLAFLAVASRARVTVTAYRDDAEAHMPADVRPMRITSIRLRPRITVAPGTDVDRVHQLVSLAHEQCFIANSLACEMSVDPTVDTAATG
jgi:organic hydroperoxide reductase OsmC/OhrA